MYWSGFFHVTQVRIDLSARDYLKYTIEIEKIDYVARHRLRPPSQRKSPVREEGTSSAGKKKKHCDDKMTQLKLQF